MISSDVIRGYNDTFILFLLLNGDSYGYEIGRNIREITEEQYIIKETTLYSAFNRLEKNKYIRSYSGGNETKGKKRTYYAITSEGQSYYEEKCKEWELTMDVVNRFVMKNKDQNLGGNLNGND